MKRTDTLSQSTPMSTLRYCTVHYTWNICAVSQSYPMATLMYCTIQYMQYSIPEIYIQHRHRVIVNSQSSIVISKILNHDFLMKIFTKPHLKKNIPPKCCYSASFGILWTHIDIFFWLKIGFQNLHFLPHYKIYVFPL